ncbi:Ent-kaurene synthase [Roridomyces roridus]|uniref:Ent-kaurene synthase n=1 Tax=Roridomyces roridus TaxID=1738132 RepID=A0AAD7CJW2_9AGAR|nr:Ent-kaurene synthase [Roridomyces roridus]
MHLPTSERLLLDEANSLLCDLLSRHTSNGLGNMSPSLYDTAWVSMVSKDGQFCFPSAFQYLLDHQAPSGGWEATSDTDSILNTLAALLSLVKHQSAGGDAHLASRIDKAELYLSARFDSWDHFHGGTRRQGIDFNFPGRDELMRLNAAKLSKLQPDMIYNNFTPLLHSLEGLIGHLDFDRLGHHKRQGHFMASPSSTAAYLIHASVWDDDCQAYLEEVLSQSAKFDRGSVPCAWPTTFFEISWIVCNLWDGGFRFQELDTAHTTRLRDILIEGIEASNGVVGFTLHVGADADDSAKILSALSHLGVHKSVVPLRTAFEREKHFQCYPFERNPSITVHCNVLSALLDAGAQDATDYNDVNESVLKAVTFIAEAWWTTNSEILDKWHDSRYYVLLLVAQSLTKFMLLFNDGHFAEFPDLLVQTKTPIVLFQALIRLLQGQGPDGSWGSCEETAYALLALVKLASLPFVAIMHETIQRSIRSGREFLASTLTGELDTGDQSCLWIDKVNYRIPPVSFSYVISALNVSAAPIPDSSSTYGHLDRLIFIPVKKVQGFSHFYGKMPLFRDCADWQLLAYIAEGYLYLPILEEVSKAVFKREGMDKEPYTEYIPFSWTAANAMRKKYSCPQNLFVLMTISLVNFQVDEFFDSMVQDEGTAALPALRKALDDIFAALYSGEDITSFDCGDGPYSKMVGYLHKYICFIDNYPTSQRASHYDKEHLRRELKAYLLSMVQQTEDNTVYAAQTSWNTVLHPAHSYLKWVRTIGSEHISGFCASSLFICHLSPGLDVFPTPELKFIAQDCITHMCVLCRIWNDWGSMDRDIAERNINGMNFPEFQGMTEPEVKAAMRRISDYERNCLHRSLADLRAAAQESMGEDQGNTWADAFDLFFRGAEVYNAIYELKDISAWKLSLVNGK